MRIREPAYQLFFSERTEIFIEGQRNIATGRGQKKGAATHKTREGDIIQGAGRVDIKEIKKQSTDHQLWRPGKRDKSNPLSRRGGKKIFRLKRKHHISTLSPPETRKDSE